MNRPVAQESEIPEAMHSEPGTIETPTQHP